MQDKLSASLVPLQGMNFIAGYLLIITKDEEKSFWLMDALLGRILPGVYAYTYLPSFWSVFVLGGLRIISHMVFI